MKADQIWIDPTPIAVIKMEKGAGVSGFTDEDPIKIGEIHARRLLRNKQIGEGIADEVIRIVADIAKTHPRILTRRMSYRVSIIDQMKALRLMPDDLGARFADGNTASIDTRDLYGKLSNAEKLEDVKSALSPSYETDGKKIQYTRLTVPREAVNLPEAIVDAYSKTGQRALFEQGSNYNYVHAFTHSVYQTPAFTNMKNILASGQPFTLGGHASMLSPHAWAILAGLDGYGMGDNAVIAGNAARTQRPNTKGLRKLYRCWLTTTHTISQYQDSPPPYGFADEPAIPLRPSPETLAEVKTYVCSIRARRWDNVIKAMIDQALEAKRKRTQREAQADKKAA